MKVFAKIRAYDRLVEQINKLRLQDREPDYAVISQEDWADIREDRRFFGAFASPWMSLNADPHFNATMVCRDFERRDVLRTRDYKRVRSMCEGKFMGCDIYVVPAEYVPA